MNTSTHGSADTMSVEDLLAHIAGRFQTARRRDLPALIELARKVEAVHLDVPDAPLGLADALARMSLALDMHMQVEAKVLFPAMLQHMDSAVAHPMAVMRHEHESYAAELDRVQELAHDFVPPIGACGSWRRLYQGVAGLCTTLREQIHLENDVLFPRFEGPGHALCTCEHS